MGKTAKVLSDVVQEKRPVKGGMEAVWRIRIRCGNKVLVSATAADEHAEEVHSIAATIVSAVQAALVSENSDTAIARIASLMNGEYDPSKLDALQALTATAIHPVGKKQRSDQRKQRRHHKTSPRRDPRRH